MAVVKGNLSHLWEGPEGVEEEAEEGVMPGCWR